MKAGGVKEIVAVNKYRDASAMSELPGRAGLCVELHCKTLRLDVLVTDTKCSERCFRANSANGRILMV
jgi:hypothetical protein